MSTRSRTVVIVFWMLAVVSLYLWIAYDPAGWDVDVYRSAMHALQAGHDPYADAIAVQDAFHRDLALHPTAAPPFSYVYSPITLPLLRIAAALPVWLCDDAYWLIYTVCALCLLWIGMQASEDIERKYLLFVAPAALAFPGMLQNDVLLSGNVAYILYALVLLAAAFAWRRGQWRWCYLAILVASCFKAPLLSLLAIPALSARRQWLPTGIAAIIGIALFAIQPLMWPSLFHHFLRAVELQFSYNRDFGCSPAGLFSNFLFTHGVPYQPAGAIAYLAYAVPVFAVLLYLSQQFLSARFSLQQWLPVLLLGVILLNPRIMQYDVALLTLPMTLIGWRYFSSFNPPSRAILFLSSILVIANFFAVRDVGQWKLVEGSLLLAFFVAGCWTLIQQSRKTSKSNPMSIDEENSAVGQIQEEDLVPVFAVRKSADQAYVTDGDPLLEG